MGSIPAGNVIPSKFGSRSEKSERNQHRCTFTKSAPRKDGRGFDLISDALLFGRLWYDGPNAVTNATGYAIHDSRSHDAVIQVYDEAGNVIRDARAHGRVQRLVSGAKQKAATR